MASITPRTSVYWSDGAGMGYFPEDDVESSIDDGRTRLDRTIDRIGMGSYQWTLLSLCGFGWMADNMWMQAIAIILPRVQQEYEVPDQYIGTLSSSMFAGMMIGAIGWGTCSDLMGRTTAFNATLFLTAVFGILTSLVTSFRWLCVVLFFLGSAVGGSMPTDGTLLLEHMPQGKQYLVTALSVFFSFGAVLAALVALFVVPQHSCLRSTSTACEDNSGWKYLLVTLGIITMSMFIARMVFFRLHESPRYLVHAGRPQEALESLQMISRFNGDDIQIDLDDVDDTSPAPSRGDETRVPFLNNNNNAERVSPPRTDYSSTGESETALRGHSFMTPTQEPQSISFISKQDIEEEEEVLPPARPRRPRLMSSSSSSRRVSSVYERKMCLMLPQWVRRPLWGWWDRVMMVLSPEWVRMTVLVWIIWCAMSLAYTMFNVFLPKLLETSISSAKDVENSKSIEDTLWDVVIFTLGGCPGAIIGAFMVESSLGKKWSLAGSTFITAAFCVGFVMSESAWAVRFNSVGVSLSATTMWAVLYGWTPQIFSTEVRGTACGIASALSRIGGMLAPMMGGVLLMIDRAFPVYTSIVVFTVAAVCVLFLREEEGKETGGGMSVVH